MIKKLERLLFEKTEGSQSDILYTQWIYDKRLVPKALSLISSIFPHYSMHDQSHSETIINNIVRLVGVDTIEQFTAIDIWFLLTSAYYHDIGMAIDAEKLEKALKSEAFINHIIDIKNDNTHYLNIYASHFHKEGKQLVLENRDFSIEVYDSVKFLLADYFRKYHAKRSEEIIIDPMKEISLNSPRGIIPQRIIKILGEICSVHTEDFEKVMKLPIKEVGIDTYDAHPRYIACLLRLGDLLDLDNNRFSDVFLRTVKTIPYDSLLHRDKHFSIIHFSVDQKEIDITAKCISYDVATITQHWFSYIRKEVVNQMLNWNNIVPNLNYGYLPTIKNLKVELEEWEYINDKEKPVFNVDTEKALELLKGTGLYSHSGQSIRELLQNSVDASLIRLWLEHHTDEQAKDLTPNNPIFQEWCKEYPITIKLDTISDITTEEDNPKWKITIEDLGIGISLDDLKFISTTGSSSKNKKKKQIIEEMPEWLRPSGAFGIGFQSIFMLADVVSIKTKSLIEQTELMIELTNPESKRKGEILIKKLPPSYKTKPGTFLSFNTEYSKLDTNESSGKYYYRLGRRYMIEDVDPFNISKGSIEMKVIIKEIQDFAKQNYFHIRLIIDGKTVSEENKKDISFGFEYFNKEHNLHFNIVNSGKPNNPNEVYYKNQLINNSSNDLRFLGSQVNILKNDTSNIISINRNYILPSYVKDFDKERLECIFKIIPEYVKSNKLNDLQKQKVSMFIHFYWEEDFAKYFKKEEYQEWQNYQILINGKGKISLKEIFDKTENIIINLIDEDEANEANDIFYKLPTFEMEGSNLELTFESTDDIMAFILHIIKKNYPYIKEELDENNRSYIRRFIRSKTESQLFNQDAVIKYITGKFCDWFSPSLERYILPCDTKYIKLRLRQDLKISYFDKHYIREFISDHFPMMMSPYSLKSSSSGDQINDESDQIVKLIVEKSVTESLYDWTYMYNIIEK
ncbi:ATP-binding protein [Dysgonomonas sp. ZJ709]|uniref:HD domain-containing protein n=1 Tax=Dysgonomonas sp. ZJ709 TaxID=2709797 RepID=UPI0013EA99AD|nr:ATP-binding protein [Dysgonomonas sp. ZJ709]